MNEFKFGISVNKQQKITCSFETKMKSQINSYLDQKGEAVRN